MKYSQEFVVRWHDTDRHLIATPSAVLTYMQETANTQCEDVGPSLARMRDVDMCGFVVSKLFLRVHKPLFANDRITVNTFVSEPRGFRFYRGFEIFRNGEMVANAVSLWALLDLNTHTLLRGDRVRFGITPEPMPDMGLPTHLRFPEPIEDCAHDYTVPYFDTDYNGHINNTHYPNLLCGFLPDFAEKTLSTLTLCYVSEARMGETLHAVTSCAEENGETAHYVRTVRADGKTNAEARVTLMSF